MALVKVNARDIILQASDTADPPTWAEVAGLTSVIINRSENQEVAATTDNDSQGVYEQDVMQRGATMALVGHLIKDSETGTLDPGQAQVTANAGQDKVGLNSHAMYRFRYPMDAEWTVWDATAALGESGGEFNAKTSFNATLTRSGPSTTEAVV